MCHFSELQETSGSQTELQAVDKESDFDHENLQEVEVFVAEVGDQPMEKVKALVRRLHNNLGHPSTRTLLRILKHAGGSEQALQAASQMESECDICINRQRPTPALPASPEQFLDFNHRVGWDVKIVPGWKQNQKIKCLNIVDFATSFQRVLPFYEAETSDVLKRLYQQGWQSWAGTPVEVVVDPARTNTAREIFDMLEGDGARVLTTAAEAHNQLGKVEKHGHLFETILVKVLDQVQPKSKEEFETCVVQTANAKNELLNQKGLSPCQLVFGRNPRVPGDLLQESPCPVAGTTPLHDPAVARAQSIRAQARTSLVMAQDNASLRTALNARPRVERDFLPGDYIAYWRSQKYEKGARLVGGRWFGTGIIMGKVGRNFLVYHRKNMFKVAPEPLRHASTEERMLAHSDSREMLGLSAMLHDHAQIGSQYVDLTKQESPPGPEGISTMGSETSPKPFAAADYWLLRGDLLVRVHVVPRKVTFMPRQDDPVLVGKSLDDWRLTIPKGCPDSYQHSPWSNPSCHEVVLNEELGLWTGETQFRIRPKRSRQIAEAAVAPEVTDASASSDKPQEHPDQSVRWSPFPIQEEPKETSSGTGYGPVRVRQQKGPPTFWFRPPEVSTDDLQELLTEQHGTKRPHSPNAEGEPDSKSSKLDPEGEECLLTQLVHEAGPNAPIECLLAGFLKKQMQKELHHSNNPPELQEKIDHSKTVEWVTLRDPEHRILILINKLLSFLIDFDLIEYIDLIDFIF